MVLCSAARFRYEISGARKGGLVCESEDDGIVSISNDAWKNSMDPLNKLSSTCPKINIILIQSFNDSSGSLHVIKIRTV